MIARLVILVGAVALAGAAIAGVANAATGQTAPLKKRPKPSSTQIPVKPAVLGLSTSTDLIGPFAATTITLPAATSATWKSLVVSIDWPVQIASATIDASDAQGRLSVVKSQADVAVPQLWVIPLRTVRGRPYEITLTSTLTFPQTNATCGASVSGVGPHLRFEQIGVQPYAGAQTIGTYLSGTVSTLTMRLPQNAPHDIQQAALRLESAVVARDLDRNVDVKLETTDAPLAKQGIFDRVVTFDPSGPEGSTLGADGLTVGGLGSALDRQVTLLSSKLVALLQTQHANAVTIPGVPHIRSSSMLLSQLGVSNLISSGAGKFQIPLGFDQAQTGGEDATMRVFLHGTNESPAVGTGATLTLLDGDVPVASTTLSASGGWHLQGVIPPTTLTRYIPLVLQVSYFGGVGSCNALLPLTVSVDPSSTISVTPGEPETLPGFLELPQIFLPHCTVVLSSPSLVNLRRAAQLVAGVQRMTSVPLTLDLSPAAALPGKRPAIVVADAGTPLATSLRPASVSNGSAQFTRNGGLTTVAVGPDEALLTAGRGQGEGLLALVSSPTHPQSGADLLAALGSSQSKWLGLTGDTAALAPNAQLATAQVNVPHLATIASAGKAWFGNIWVVVAIGVAGVIALAVILQGLARRRRRDPE